MILNKCLAFDRAGEETYRKLCPLSDYVHDRDMPSTIE